MSFIEKVSAAPAGYQIPNPIGANNLEEVLQKVTGAILDLAIPIAAALYIYAGFLWLTSAGKPNKIAQAKTVFKYTTIGLVIIFIGGGFVELIKSILNLGQ
jgi:TRAP-type C4-dicarboxylate transport system permease small subunit